MQACEVDESTAIGSWIRRDSVTYMFGVIFPYRTIIDVVFQIFEAKDMICTMDPFVVILDGPLSEIMETPAVSIADFMSYLDQSLGFTSSYTLPTHAAERYTILTSVMGKSVYIGEKLKVIGSVYAIFSLNRSVPIRHLPHPVIKNIPCNLLDVDMLAILRGVEAGYDTPGDIINLTDYHRAVLGPVITRSSLRALLAM